MYVDERRLTYLSADHHVLDDVVHVWDEGGDVGVEQHHQRSTHILAHIRVVIHGQVEEVLWKRRGSE